MKSNGYSSHRYHYSKASYCHYSKTSYCHYFPSAGEKSIDRQVEQCAAAAGDYSRPVQIQDPRSPRERIRKHAREAGTGLIFPKIREIFNGKSMEIDFP